MFSFLYTHLLNLCAFLSSWIGFSTYPYLGCTFCRLQVDNVRELVSLDVMLTCFASRPSFDIPIYIYVLWDNNSSNFKMSISSWNVVDNHIPALCTVTQWIGPVNYRCWIHRLFICWTLVNLGCWLAGFKFCGDFVGCWL